MTYNVFSGTLNPTQSVSKLTYFCVHWMLNLYEQNAIETGPTNTNDVVALFSGTQ